MKRFSILIRLLITLLACTSLYFLLLGPTKVNIDDTHEMATTIIDRVARESDNNQIKLGLNLIKKSGLEKILIANLPRSYHAEFSYADVYHLTTTYDEKGKISSSDLGLKANNQLETVINEYLIAEINYKLEEEADQVYHLISIYRYSIFAIILLYLLAIALIWLKRSSASIPILIGSLITFGALWFFSNEMSLELQNKIYRGIKINISPEIWIGLLISIIIGICWPVLVNIIKRNDAKNA